MPTREQTKADTREALVDAALLAFVEEGLDASLDGICRRAGYTRGAFYVHFPDREALWVAVVEHVLGRYLAVVQESADAAHDLEAAIDRFTDGFVAMLDSAAGQFPSLHGFPLVMDACRRSRTIRARFAELLVDGARRVAHAARAGQSAGTVRSDLDPDVASTLLVALVLGLLTSAWMGVPVDAVEARRQMRAIIAA